MKYALLVGDGMADAPIDKLGGATPLEYAKTPNMDAIAAEGCVGLVKTVPDGIEPGSDVANMSLMGYNPLKEYNGRAPIEAASMGITLSPLDTAFRCNLVHIKNGRMIDYSSGHIETEDSHKLIKGLQSLNSEKVHFYPGVSYRHLLVLSDFRHGELTLTPPHNISGKYIEEYIPRGDGSEKLMELSQKARDILDSCEVNARRAKHGKITATDIWLWGQGKAITLDTLEKRFGLRGSVISAVDLIRGLGKLAGLTVRRVEGATGYLGTNYAGKAEAACKAFRDEDFVYLHVEAPDETSHEGSLEKKIQAIEEFDRYIVGAIRELRNRYGDLRIMTLPDHGTWLSTRTHHRQPVPFAVSGPDIAPDNTSSYCERSGRGKPLYSGPELFSTFINGNFR